MVNKKLVKTLLNRHASRIPALEFVFLELAQRMMTRLDYIKINPNVLLDCGSGLGYDSRLLKEKYPNATILSMDIARNLLCLCQDKPKGFRKWFGTKGKRHLVCADALKLPFANSSIDFYYSNLLLAYLDEPMLMIREMRRVLASDRGFCIAGLGVDSLKELRQFGLYTHNFPDMHDIGDMLLSAGFSNPVVDTEYLVLDYEHLQTLVQDIKLVGAGAAFGKSGYFSRHKLQELKTHYQMPSKLTLEIFVAHGWKEWQQIDLPAGVSGINFMPKSVHE